MVRRSKTARERSVNYKRPKLPGKKGQVKDPQKRGIYTNALTGDVSQAAFIPKIS
jgi:hypothetical protein